MSLNNETGAKLYMPEDRLISIEQYVVGQTYDVHFSGIKKCLL